MNTRNGNQESASKSASEGAGLASTTGPSSPQAVHEVIMRVVRPGREREFEALIERFFRQAAQQPGVLGSYLIRPISNSQPSHYGILRSFNATEDRDKFYGSDLYRQWNESVAPP